MASLVVGIDAANLLGGGGRTHLIELLRAAEPYKHGIHRVVVWAAKETLQLIEDREWIEKRSPYLLNRGTVSRTIWQRFRLSKEAFREECDVLFIPGGSFTGNFRPTVVMSRNMLPFEWRELRRFGFSLTSLRYLLLRLIQSRSFCKANGMIFLTQYASVAVQKVTGELTGLVTVVPHGINERFRCAPRAQIKIHEAFQERPFRILYVSTVNEYKHQSSVVEALGRLRARAGWAVALDLVGSGRKQSLRRLRNIVEYWDAEGSWVTYHGAVPFEELHKIYQQADLGLFASSCENMPNILVETMAAGLPIACSDRGPMPEILGDSGVYFDPTSPQSIESSVEHLIRDTPRRNIYASKSFSRAFDFSWSKCSDETFSFLGKVASESFYRVQREVG